VRRRIAYLNSRADIERSVTGQYFDVAVESSILGIDWHIAEVSVHAAFEGVAKIRFTEIELDGLLAKKTKVRIPTAKAPIE